MSTPSEIRVVVVDDQPVFHDLVVGLLERDPGVSVVGVASTVDQALRQVRVHQPDVVVMDQQLPDGHGTDAARRITRGFRHARVVMLTASADEHSVQAAKKAGCSGYVTKDRVAHDILTAVKGAFRWETKVPDGVAVFLRFSPKDTDPR